MATRPPRLKRPHTYFHVTTQGTNRWNIFLDDNDRRRFMYLLIATCERYRIEVQAFCLMGNHVHLVLYCPEPVLSAAMRDLKSRYAKYFHRYHKSSGPLFEAPFLEVPILTDEHLMTEVRYTHRNPLDLDATVCLATCQWSSHGIYLGLRPEPSFMNTSVVRELFGPNYRLEVERPRPNVRVQNRVRPIIDVARTGRWQESRERLPTQRIVSWSMCGPVATTDCWALQSRSPSTWDASRRQRSPSPMATLRLKRSKWRRAGLVVDLKTTTIYGECIT